MIKRYKRIHAGWMRRASRIYLNNANQSKAKRLHAFLNEYQKAVNYCIVRFWSAKTFSNKLTGTNVIKAIQERFGLTARLGQCISKQAKEIVRSQAKRRKKRMPRFKAHTANLDSRFVSIEKFHGHFEMCLKFSSGVPKLILPFNWTMHTNKFRNNGFELSKSIQLGYDDEGLFVNLIFEKERPPKRIEGKIIGVDRGLNTMLCTSDGQDIGKRLKDKIKSAGKRRKSYHHFIETEENRFLKNLNLERVKTVVLENLKLVKSHKRGKFPRRVNRLLSFWHYAKVGSRLKQLCEEKGVTIHLKSPWKTSQSCPYCGNIDRRNRKGEKFLCLRCGYEANADWVGAKNLELLGLAGVYSLRSLSSEFYGENKCL